MSFFDLSNKLQDFDFEGFFDEVTTDRVKSALEKDCLTEEDFLCLLSPAATGFIEEMAQIANKITLGNFGKAVVLYAPIYISNYCENQCAYCGFNVMNKISRKKLTLEEVEKEAQALASTGIKHIILLTGESRFYSPVSYIKDSVKILKKYFSSICIEIYPLTEDEYRELVESGVDALTIYQETYNPKIYDQIHLAGPKKDYRYRLETPERACRAGIRGMGVGALYGLDSWRKEAYFSGLHAKYIQDNFPHMEISMSVPRIRPHAGSFTEIQEVNDENLVQIMLAFKIFIPRAGINMTTRESAELRDNLIPLGVTKMSAGVSTEIGGYSDIDKGEKQFEISDDRSVKEIKEMLEAKGYCPIFKDWEWV